MCGPTAEEVFLEAANHVTKMDGQSYFVDWYTPLVQPTADVTAPLEKRIAKLETEAGKKLHIIEALTRDGQTRQRERESAKELLVAALKHDAELGIEAKELESQLTAAKAEHERQHNDVISIVQLASGTNQWCHKESVIRRICGNGSGRCQHKIEPKAAPCMTEKEALDAAAEIVAVYCERQGNHIYAWPLRHGVQRGPGSVGMWEAIKALAGHVADQTAEVTRLRQQSSRCIQAAFVGNDSNRYDSVPEMLADLIRKHCDERGQEIHKLCGIVGKRNQTIRELRAEPDQRTDPKPEWPKWRKWYVTVAHSCFAQYARLDSPDSTPVFFHADGSPGGDEGNSWYSSRERFNAAPSWLPIPSEPDAVCERRKENEWPKYVVMCDGKPIGALRRLDGLGKGVVRFSSNGAEQERGALKAETYLDQRGIGKGCYSRIPTAEAEAMIASAKERAKPTERYWTDGNWMWRWANGCMGRCHKNKVGVWCVSKNTPERLDTLWKVDKVSSVEAEAIMAGWKEDAHPQSVSLGPTDNSRCPECSNSLQNGIPQGLPKLRRCASCGTVFQASKKEQGQ